MIGYIILTVLKIWYKYQSCLNHSRKRQRSEFGFQPWQGQPHHPPPGIWGVLLAVLSQGVVSTAITACCLPDHGEAVRMVKASWTEAIWNRLRKKDCVCVRVFESESVSVCACGCVCLTLKAFYPNYFEHRLAYEHLHWYLQQMILTRVLCLLNQ